MCRNRRGKSLSRQHKLCDQGHEIGTEHIHKNLHILFSQKPFLTSRYIVNTIVIEYWKMFNKFGLITLLPEQLESLQSIDREIRNIIPANQKGKLKEEEVRYYYGWNKGMIQSV